MSGEESKAKKRQRDQDSTRQPSAGPVLRGTQVGRAPWGPATLPIEPDELRGGVHDAAADDGEHGREPSDIVGWDGEVVVAQDDEVGMLADFHRSHLPL